MRTLIAFSGIALFALAGLGSACGAQSEAEAEEKVPQTTEAPAPIAADSLECDSVVAEELLDAGMPAEDAKSRYTTLSDADFKKVANELGVEVAAIKAVVLIEAGTKMEGFWAPGVPVVNFDNSMYKIYGKKGASKGNPNEKVPAGLKGYALQEWTQLVNARKKNVDGANMGAFWGMFQIGGFNYKRCGCASVAEFVKRMSDSEFEQLELFAEFIVNSGMLSDLKSKNWASFARKYNGSGYAKKGYHTKMANAYAKFKKEK